AGRAVSTRHGAGTPCQFERRDECSRPGLRLEQVLGFREITPRAPNAEVLAMIAGHLLETQAGP
ncbi:MAG TPA: hypothetical protein VFG30_43835, partial [Polyangiales bacterium]|nr:hypothetical protein [Polyangiales bacterium]